MRGSNSSISLSFSIHAYWCYASSFHQLLRQLPLNVSSNLPEQPAVAKLLELT